MCYACDDTRCSSVAGLEQRRYKNRHRCLEQQEHGMIETSSTTTDLGLLRQLGKDPGMHIQSCEPANLETPLDALDSALTPRDAFFMRNNHALPQIAPVEWSLTIDGHVERPYTLSYADLLGLPTTSLIAFLECYGNSRRRFAEQGPPAEGIPWGNG